MSVAVSGMLLQLRASLGTFGLYSSYLRFLCVPVAPYSTTALQVLAIPRRHG